jgi:protein translocase SecG subunit
MNNILNITEIVLAIALIVFVLLQRQGGGTASIFGGSGSESYRTKRGAEKIFFYGTIISAILFVGIAIIRIVLL